MSIPPSMLKSMEPKYRLEPFDSIAATVKVTELYLPNGRKCRPGPSDSTTELTEVTVSRVAGGRQRNMSWPTIEYGIARSRLWQEIWVLAVAVGVGFILIFAKTEPQARSKLFLIMTFCLFMLPQTLAALARALLPDWRGRVRLESDCLVFEPGLAHAPRSVRYEQIWYVDFLKGTRSVYVKYYPIKFYDQLDMGRVAEMSLKYIQDGEGLASELGRRTFGAPPERGVEVKHAILGLLRAFGWLLLLGVMWFTTVEIFSILAALNSLQLTG
jgi:hypothetical protein